MEWLILTALKFTGINIIVVSCCSDICSWILDFHFAYDT